MDRYNLEIYEREDGTCEASLGYDEDEGELCYYEAHLAEITELKKKLKQIEELFFYVEEVVTPLGRVSKEGILKVLLEKGDG